ncbi:MAG TPA: flagellar motor stator protein MotA [Smithellaceae bacterium]|nr:flagellar motor stator protein MotA [Smithellaceae bacterium]HQF84269.1 flagellar motor stator protein MotA [Smithellaceae bacterium]HQG80564.1 flagellar motor stator protein MotA [Smithellaceae bacterium]
MIAIIGFVIVSAAVIGGYLLEGGNLSVIFQPVEILIIGGAAIGGFIIASPMKVIKATGSSIARIFSNKPYTKQDYMEVLIMINGIFYKIRQQGLVSIESDVDEPEQSPLFSQYPNILKNHAAITLITDTLRTVMTTTIAPHELEALIDQELEALHDEAMAPAQSVGTVADALPGLGIVAAVMGVVLTMGKIKEPPEVLGASIGAALVGTFTGVLLCYGYVGPMGKNMEFIANEDQKFLNVIKVALLAFIGGGAAPKVAVEFGRRVVPVEAKPSFLEMEDALRAAKK